MNKLWGIFVSLAVALAVLSPVLEEGEREDSFPLSWYPMFSRPRPDPESTNYVVGFEADGTRHIVPSRHYVPGGMNQARRQLSVLVGSKKTAQETCEKTANAAAKRSTGPLSRVKEIRVVRGYFHMRKYFGEGIKTPERERVFARCRVKRKQSDRDSAKGVN